MTTERIAIRREVVSDWPSFVSDSEIPAAVGVTSIEVRRRVDESVASAAVVAATVLAAALGELLPSDRGRLWILGIGRPTPRSNRVAAYKAERDKLWGALEKSGVVLPAGARAESELEPSADVLRFGGAIELTIDELPVALEVTRRENAICVGNIDGASGLDWESLISSSVLVSNDAAGLLRAVLHQMSGGMFAARSFGQFDDAIVTSAAFGENEVLNRLESILQRAA